MAIQARLHFCWIGPRLSWAYVFGILSAVERSTIVDITLHHTDTLEDDGPLRMLRSAQSVRLHAIHPTSYLLQTGQDIGLQSQLEQLYTALENVVMRADLLRAAILYNEGGVYLDLDTLTVASLRPLLDTPVFLSSESIIWPRRVRQSRSPFLWVRHLTLDVIRKTCRQAPHGWRVFRHVEGWCVRNVNNAIMGAEAKSAFLAAYMCGMATMSSHQLAVRTALGPGLLQQVLDQHDNGKVQVHNPGVFSPLPPEISEHWFRITSHLAVADVLLPETRVVHWYASVRTRHLVAQITPAYVLSNRHRQLYSALVYSCIGSSAVFRSLHDNSSHIQ